MIRVAPAGWSYPDWEGRVYPRARPTGFHPLAHLARFVDGMEINSSFYALPQPAHASTWATHVAPHPEFRFVAKLYQGFTHAPEEPARWDAEAETYRAALQPLVRRKLLSAVLVQFPVSFQHGVAEVGRLGRIATLLDGLPLVLEVRHVSWFEPPVFRTLRGLGYSLAHIDLPAAWNHPPERHPATGPIGYLRLHGRNEDTWFRKGVGRDARYDYLYSPSEVGSLAHRAASIASETDETWVVTNNHFEGQAVANALELKYMLGGKQPVPAPPEIVEAFPHLEAVTRIEGQRRLFP